MESEQLYHRGYCRNSYNSIASASSDEELLDGAGVIMDFHTTEDDNLLDGDAASPGREYRTPHLEADEPQPSLSSHIGSLLEVSPRLPSCPGLPLVLGWPHKAENVLNSGWESPSLIERICGVTPPLFFPPPTRPPAAVADVLSRPPDTQHPFTMIVLPPAGPAEPHTWLETSETHEAQ